MATANRKPQKRPLSLVTRVVVVPLLLLAIGVRIGMYIGPGRGPAAAPERAAAQAAPPAPPPAPDAQAKVQAGPPLCEITASFQDNIYPSLLLSFGTAYPEYSRCISVDLRNLPLSGSLQLRVDSSLFLRPLQVPF